LQTIHNSEREAIRNRRNEKENLITKPLDRTSIEEAEFAENPIKSRPEEIRSMKIIYTALALFTAFASVAYAATEDTTILKVKSVKSYENGTNEISPNQRIVVAVNHLDSLKGKPIVLFIDGMQLIDCMPLSTNMAKQELVFLLRRTDSTENVWKILLGRPTLSKSVIVSIGIKNSSPIPSDPAEGRIVLDILKSYLFWVFVAFFLGFLVVIIFLITKTSLLRDDGPELNVNGVIKKRMFSLARTQMLLWTILVVGSFVLIWSVTGEMNTIPGSILILMGISIATALCARSIGDPQPNDAPTTGNFMKDIMTGSSDNELHRLQIVIWTIVLAIIFINSVYENLAMPDFNGTLLTLMGISSGTYIGFKLKE
jgi:hypothetical protein